MSPTVTSAASSPLPAADRRLVVAAFLALFGILCCQTLLETARDALFLTRISVGRLPWVYLALAALSLPTAAVVQFDGRRGGSRGVTIPILVGAVITAGIAVALAGSSPAAVYALFLWSGVFSAFAVTRVWTVLAEALDMSVAKRLYGQLGAGGGLGAISGAALARLLSDHVSPREMVLLAALVAAATALGPALALRAPTVLEGSHAAQRPDARVVTASRRSGRAVASPYVARLVLVALLAAAVSTLLDFSFKEGVALRVPGARLPAFFATFHLVSNSVSLGVQLFGVSPWIRLAGVRRTPLLIPTMLLLGMAFTVAAGGLVGLLLLRGLDAALRNSIHRATFELLQVPLGDRLRRRAKPLIDTLGLRGGQALGALGLLALFGSTAGPGARLVLVAVLLSIWAVIALDLGRRYVDFLRATLLLPGIEDHSLATPKAALECAPEPDGQSDVPRLLLDIDSERAIGPLLDRLLVEKDARARSHILRALERVRRAHSYVEIDEDILGRAAAEAVRSAYRYLAWRVFLEAGAARLPGRRTPTWALLRDLLAKKEEIAVQHLFQVLSLRYPRDDFRRLLCTMRTGGRRTRAAARELLENLLSGPARVLTLALVVDAGDRERLAAMARDPPPPPPRYRALLAAIRAEDAGGTLSALAARHVAELGGLDVPVAEALSEQHERDGREASS